MRFKTGAIGLLAVLASTTALRAESLCDGIKRVLADAPNDFASIRGPVDSGEEYYFSPTYLLPGAIAIDGSDSKCSVGDFERVYTYECTLPLSGSAPDSVRAVANAVSACIGQPVDDSLFSAEGYYSIGLVSVGTEVTEPDHKPIGVDIQFHAH